MKWNRQSLVKRLWKPALWALFILNALLLPLLLGGAGSDEAFELPSWAPQSAVALIAIQTAGIAFALPNTIFCVTAGFVFGLWQGMLIATVGSFLGSLAAFTMGRTITRHFAPRIARRIASPERIVQRFPRASRILNALGDATAKTVALTRLSPLIPFAVQNFAWSLTPVPFRNYALGSLLSVPVGASFFAHLGAAGKEGANLATQNYSWSAALTVIGVAATFFLVRYLSNLADKALASTDPPPPQQDC